MGVFWTFTACLDSGPAGAATRPAGGFRNAFRRPGLRPPVRGKALILPSPVLGGPGYGLVVHKHTALEAASATYKGAVASMIGGIAGAR